MNAGKGRGMNSGTRWVKRETGGRRVVMDCQEVLQDLDRLHVDWLCESRCVCVASGWFMRRMVSSAERGGQRAMANSGDLDRDEVCCVA